MSYVNSISIKLEKKKLMQGNLLQEKKADIPPSLWVAGSSGTLCPNTQLPQVAQGPSEQVQRWLSVEMRTRGTSENEELMLCPWHSLSIFSTFVLGPSLM